MIEKLIEYLRKLNPVNAELEEKIRTTARINTFPAGRFLLKDGQVCDKACVILEGITRSFYQLEGKDVTSRFMLEGDIITSWMSYYKQQPGNEFIECLETTTLGCLSYPAIQRLYHEHVDFNTIGRKQVEYALYSSEQRTQTLRSHSAEERYRLFFEYHPDLIQRVPLKHIASYLGMSEETLSRVRTKFHNSNK